MLPIRFIPNLLVLGLCALATSCANAPVVPAAEPGGMPQPTADHKELMRGVGSWEGTLTSYVPGQPESTIPAQEEVVGVGVYEPGCGLLSDRAAAGGRCCGRGTGRV